MRSVYLGRGERAIRASVEDGVPVPDAASARAQEMIVNDGIAESELVINSDIAADMDSSSAIERPVNKPDASHLAEYSPEFRARYFRRRYR